MSDRLLCLYMCTLPVFDRVRVRVRVRFNVQITYNNSIFFKNSLSASWPVRELSSPRLDWPRVGLSASCPVSVPSTPPRLSVESKRAQTIDFESFVDKFDARHQNRKVTLHWGLHILYISVLERSICLASVYAVISSHRGRGTSDHCVTYRVQYM